MASEVAEYGWTYGERNGERFLRFRINVDIEIPIIGDSVHPSVLEFIQGVSRSPWVSVAVPCDKRVRLLLGDTEAVIDLQHCGLTKRNLPQYIIGLVSDIGNY